MTNEPDQNQDQGTPESPRPALYKTGTLEYTKAGLLVLFCWLLWGDFCFTLMERVRPAIMPLFLMGKAGGIETSNKVVYLMMVVIPGITGLFIGPVVSFKSDRHRGPHGRRIPYITKTTPFLVIGLIGMGFAPNFRDYFVGTWAAPQTVTVTAIGDANVEGTQQASITHAIATEDPVYTGLTLDQRATTVTYHTTGVKIAESDGSTEVNETAPYGGLLGASSDTYTLQLYSEPKADVTITVDPDAQVDLGNGPDKAIDLTFTPKNWNASQTVKVRAVDDSLPEGRHTATITHTATSTDTAYNGVPINDMVVSLIDNDQPGITVNETRDETAVNEAGPTSDKYTFVLDIKPTADVTIAVTPDAQIDLGAGPGQPINVTFTPDKWKAAQAVSVTAVDDATPEGDHTATITHAVTSTDARYNGVALHDLKGKKLDQIQVKLTDNDAPGVIITHTDGSTDVREIGPSEDMYRVALATAPKANVTITVTSDTQTRLAKKPGKPVTLTFTPKNWQQSQIVTVTAIDDKEVEGPHTSTITHVVKSEDPVYGNMTIDDVVVNVADNDKPGVTITSIAADDTDDDGKPKPIPASRTYTVVLDSPPAEDVAITLTPDLTTDCGAGPGQAVTLAFKKPNAKLLGLDPIALTLLVIGLFVVMFHFFDEFVNSVFWYLFADVVPEELLGRFLALFRLVGTAAGFIWSWWVFPYAETHMQHIFIGISVLYLVGFTMMCWKVKEGDYPPPDDLGEKPSVLKQVKVYITECFGHPIYIFMFAYTAFFFSANVVGFGNIVFTRDGIGLTMEQIGKIGAIVALVTMLFQYPSGWLVDKFHAVRVTFVTLVLMIPVDFFAFFYLKDLTTYIVLQGIKLVVFGLNGAAGMPLYVLVFPRDKYGQFASCNGMVRSTSLMLTGIFGAMFMDYFTNNGADKDAFRWMFIWMAGCQALAAVCLFVVFGIWKKRGGAQGYLPPGSLREREMLAATAGGNGGQVDHNSADGDQPDGDKKG